MEHRIKLNVPKIVAQSPYSTCDVSIPKILTQIRTGKIWKNAIVVVPMRKGIMIMRFFLGEFYTENAVCEYDGSSTRGIKLCGSDECFLTAIWNKHSPPRVDVSLSQMYYMHFDLRIMTLWLWITPSDPHSIKMQYLSPDAIQRLVISPLYMAKSQMHAIYYIATLYRWCGRCISSSAFVQSYSSRSDARSFSAMALHLTGSPFIICWRFQFSSNAILRQRSVASCIIVLIQCAFFFTLHTIIFYE